MAQEIFEDIFDKDNMNSVVWQTVKKNVKLEEVVWQIARGKDKIDLRNFDLDTYEIPVSYITITLVIDSDNYAQQIRRTVDRIVEAAEKRGCSPNLHTAIYEAALNAYQHGNKCDPDKKILISYVLRDNTIEVAVIDEGGEIDTKFLPFILKHKSEGCKDQYIDFYEFTGQDKPKRNNGTGTSFMHAYVDDVFYFKSAEGGLVVHLSKKLNGK